MADGTHLPSLIDDEGAILLDIEQDRFLTLNATGSFIWRRYTQGESIAEIARALAVETGTDLTVVERDVREFIGDLQVGTPRNAL